MPCGCSTNNNNLLVHLHGAVTKPYVVGKEANQLEMIVSIEFKPAGLYALTGISQNELTDRTISFETVNTEFSKLISEMVKPRYSPTKNQKENIGKNHLCTYIQVAIPTRIIASLNSPQREYHGTLIMKVQSLQCSSAHIL